MRSYARAGFSLTAFALSILGGTTVWAQATTDIRQIDIPVNNPIGSSCAGEAIDVTGTIQLIFEETIDDSGGVHLRFHLNTEGVSGTGETSGLLYQMIQVTNQDRNLAGPPPLENTNDEIVRVIGQGPDNDRQFHFLSHITIDANGDITATVSDFSFECR